jgi:hypothetical protein
MVCSLWKFQLFIYICSGFWSLFADYAKPYVILTGRKSCCRLGSLFKEVKDVVACLILGLEGKMIP